MPYVIGGTINGNRNRSINSRLPMKFRRASVYAAGTPTRRANNTTSKTTSIVTKSTSPSWNSFHAAVYQFVVHPSGSQVPSQRRANELVATDAIINAMLMTKSVIRPHNKPPHACASHLREVESTLTPCRRRRDRDRTYCGEPEPPRRSA